MSGIPFQSLQNIGGRCFEGHATAGGSPELHALEIAFLQVNMGYRCNQSCYHCYVEAGPNRTEEMTRETVDAVLAVLRRHVIGTLDITGGAPEMNPHFRYLVKQAVPCCERVVDRCNLTILEEPGQEDTPAFLASHGVEIVASLPWDESFEVDRQRGVGTFDKSIEALRRLNEVGYGRVGTGLWLNLVYNPLGPVLAPPQRDLQRRYRQQLSQRFGIEFNRLFAMNNMPIRRFLHELDRSGQRPVYLDRLVQAFNAATVDRLMCRHGLSVGWDGRLYDCDFNQSQGIPLGSNLPQHVRNFDLASLRARRITTGVSCFGCTAGAGSSCNGALVDTSTQGEDVDVRVHESQEFSGACSSAVRAGDS